MRILSVTPSFLPNVGGLELCLHNISLAHHESGHPTMVAAPIASAPVARAVPYGCVPIVRHGFARAALAPDADLPTTGRRLLRARLHLLQRLHRPDVWQLEDVYPSGWSVLDIIQNELRVPVVLAAHGGDIHVDEATGFGERLNDHAEERIRSTLARADALIAINQRVHDTYVSLGASPDSICIIEQGKAARHLANANAAASTEHPFTFLTVAADRPEKRIDLVIETAKRLPRTLDWRWTVLTTTDRLAEKARQSGLGDRVEVVVQRELTNTDIGEMLPQRSVFDHFARASVLVHTSRTEGASNVFRESWASGCPVVASIGAGALDVSDGVDGLLYDTDDEVALSQLLGHLLTSPDDLRELRAGARERGEQTRTWSDVARERRDLYSGL